MNNKHRKMKKNISFSVLVKNYSVYLRYTKQHPNGNYPEKHGCFNYQS